jgi:hypothetical protein
MLAYDPATGRYHLHELIRQLAEERLADSEQESSANRKHTLHFLPYAHRAWLQAEWDGEWDAYQRQIDCELDNCRAALQRALAAGDTDTALQLATTLAGYLTDHGLGYEAVRSLEEALAAGGERSPPAIRAAAYLSLSYIWYETRGGRKTVIELAKRGLALYQAIEDQEGVAHALYCCGYAYHGYDWERSRTYVTQSVAAYKEAGIENINSLQLLENIEILTGNLQEARSLIARRRTIYEKQANESGLVYTNTWLAFVHYYEGRLEEAQILAEEAVQYRRIHGPELARIHPLDVLVPIALDKGRFARARALLCERLRIMVNNNMMANAIFCFDEIAEWLFLTDRPRQAAFWLGCFDRVREWTKQPVEPVALPHYQWLVSEVGNALGEEAYTAAWQKGYAVPVHDALPLALQMMEQTAVYPQK